MNIHLKSFLHTISGLLIAGALAACASGGSPMGGEYDEPVMVGKTLPLNLTGNPSTNGAAEVYFEAREHDGKHDKLLAILVDGEALANTNPSLLNIKGYQALALKPGVHSIGYCFHGKAMFGSVGSCKFLIDKFNFEAGTRYMVVAASSVSASSQMIGNKFYTSQEIEIRTGIVKLGQTSTAPATP